MLKKKIQYWLLILLSMFLLLSCGTRKRLMHKTSKNISSLQQNDIVAIKTNNIKTDVHITRTDEKVVFKAIDNSKPFFVDGKKYQNVVVEKKITQKVDSSKVLDNTIEEKKDQSVQHIEIKEKEKKVDVERDNSFGFWDWFWLLLAIVCVFFLVFRWKNIYAFLIKIVKKTVL